MKKFFFFVLALTVALSVSASTEVVFDFSDPTVFGYEKAARNSGTNLGVGDKLEKDGVTFTVDNVGTTSGVRFFTSNTDAEVVNLRAYKGVQATIAAPNGKKLLAVTLTGSNLTGAYVSGDLEGGKWTGNADNVRLEVIQSTVQINTMTVVYGDEGETPEVWVPDTISVAQARALIDAGDKKDHYVKGVVASEIQDYTATYGNINFDMSDIDDPSAIIYGYKITGYKGEKFSSIDDVPFIEGDTILVYAGALQLYNTTYEINTGNLAEILGSAERAGVYTVEFASALAKVSTEEASIDLNFYTDAEGTKLVYSLLDNLTSEKSIATTYDAANTTLVYNGANVTLVSGTLRLTYVETNAAMQNTYRVVLSAQDAEGATYKADNTILVEGLNADTNEEVFFLDDNTNINVAMALAVCEQIGATESEQYYNIYGYIANITEDFSSYKNMTFYMSDDANATSGDFYAYRVSASAAIPQGSYVKVTAKLINYKGNTPETVQGTGSVVAFNVEDTPVLRQAQVAAPDTISANKAYEIGLALENETAGETVYSEKTYVVIGYCTNVKTAYDEEYKNETWFMADSPEEYGNLQIYRGRPDYPVEKGDKVMVKGKIANYRYESGDHSIQISTPNAVHTELDIPQGVEQVAAESQAALKTIKDGQLLIIRNGVTYTVQGQQY